MSHGKEPESLKDVVGGIEGLGEEKKDVTLGDALDAIAVSRPC